MKPPFKAVIEDVQTIKNQPIIGKMKHFLHYMYCVLYYISKYCYIFISVFFFDNIKINAFSA